MGALFSYFGFMGRNIRKRNISLVEVFVLYVKAFAFFKYMYSYKGIDKKLYSAFCSNSCFVDEHPSAMSLHECIVLREQSSSLFGAFTPLPLIIKIRWTQK